MNNYNNKINNNNIYLYICLIIIYIIYIYILYIIYIYISYIVYTCMCKDMLHDFLFFLSNLLNNYNKILCKFIFL